MILKDNRKIYRHETNINDVVDVDDENRLYLIFFFFLSVPSMHTVWHCCYYYHLFRFFFSLIRSSSFRRHSSCISFGIVRRSLFFSFSLRFFFISLHLLSFLRVILLEIFSCVVSFFFGDVAFIARCLHLMHLYCNRWLGRMSTGSINGKIFCCCSTTMMTTTTTKEEIMWDLAAG